MAQQTFRKAIKL